MDAADTSEGRGRGRVIAALVAALVALVLAAVWSQRKPIATGFVDRALKARGVPARYRIASLGVYEQRLVDVSIGHPARPDLTAAEAVLRLSLGVNGPQVESIRARGVRLRGRVVDGRVSLGAIDRLMPAPDGTPFALPALDVDLTDARMRLETPAGPLGLALAGRGRLSDGFRGMLAISSRDLALAGCRSRGATAELNLAVTERRPAIDGPVRVPQLACGGFTATGARAAVDLRLFAALDRWDGGGWVRIDRLAAGGATLANVVGSVGVGGNAKATQGDVELLVGRATTAAAVARQAGFRGRYRVGGGEARLAGRLSVPDAALSGPSVRTIAAAGKGGGGTPFAPLLAAATRAAAAAGRALSGDAALVVAVRGGRGAVEVRRLALASGSGARLGVPGTIGYSWPAGRVRVAGAIGFGGGGLPAGRIVLRPDAVGALAGTAVLAPYAAGGARLALAPVRFDRARGATRFATALTLDGPLGGGRVDGMTLPVRGRLGADGALVVNEACAPLGWSRLAIAGLVAGPARLRLCPDGRALAWRTGGGGLRGGGFVPAPRVAGRLGGSPVTIAATRLGFAVGRPGFVADALAVRLGTAPSLSRLDVARLAGEFGARGIGGRFAGLGGKIGAVPLILSDGEGRWTLAGGVLDLAGALRVTDEAAPARFEPLRADGVTLRLAGGRIVAGGTLREPALGIAVSNVAIRHDLSAGRGDALLDVPGLAFTEALQPERLTRLTLGVIANVRGTIAGQGRIAWGRDGVVSGGTFRTEGMDLAAAFGPVKGLAGTLTFTDLLGLVSAPDQVATVAEINPGIAVTNGTFRYRLLADRRVAVAGARWPFSGGELLLEPTILDFGRPSQRRMTFRVVGMDAAEFVEQFDFKNVAVTGTFDGTLPIVFDETGGRIEQGRLRVRPGGGTLAYVGEVSNAKLGLFGSLAFDALKRMRYARLSIDLDGSLDGELISRVLFDGTNETPKEAARRNGLLSQFSNLPFRFTITVRAPFRGLLNSARSLNDPRGLIEQARPEPVMPLPGGQP